MHAPRSEIWYFYFIIIYNYYYEVTVSPTNKCHYSPGIFSDWKTNYRNSYEVHVRTFLQN